MASFRLLRPRHPEIQETAAYYQIQAMHRRAAIDLALGAISDLESGPDDGLVELHEIVRSWASDSLIQGACLREYHCWEVATKNYLRAACIRAGAPEADWRKSGSHPQKVNAKFEEFGVLPAASMPLLDRMRLDLNSLKHRGTYEVLLRDYNDLCEGINSFWEHVDHHEIFVW